MAAASRFGFWAALAACAAAIGYIIPQLLQVAGMLADPWDRILIFAPSLLLAPCYVLAVAAAHAATPRDGKVWSVAALCLAILYAADVSMMYVMQLGSVIPHDMRGEGAAVAWASCCAYGMPTMAVDLLGYTWMSASTLLLAPAFPGGGRRRWLRGALVANGLVGIPIFGQLAWPELLYAASPWIVTFPAAMILLALELGGETPARADCRSP
ncbi:MAG: hypothetical protein GC201_03605 [Alphaproteobacteria bacterium]|nr:hypothetical protein [Alphaproteobacteria bacterium]